MIAVKEDWRNHERYVDATAHEALFNISRSDWKKSIRRGDVYYIEGARTYKGNYAVRAAVVISND